ncbi:MAG: hypothetical protein EOP84_20370 [Verrucomicrobiaceae bacterium]|nr:MAG: hypothetical protein EOP84_20370 [Verrucomicrobiaceae bacterium]
MRHPAKGGRGYLRSWPRAVRPGCRGASGVSVYDNVQQLPYNPLMVAVRRLLFGLGFLALAVLLARHSAGLPRSAWFARTNYMAGAVVCGAAVFSLILQSLKVSPEKYTAIFWKVVPILSFVGVVMMWGGLIAFPRMASKPIVWFLNIGCTLCFVLLLRIKKWGGVAEATPVREGPGGTVPYDG